MSQLYPKQLQSKVLESNKNAMEGWFNGKLSEILAEITRVKSSAGYKADKMTKEEFKSLADLSDKHQCLMDSYKSYKPTGPILDVVTFRNKDGAMMALVPTEEDAVYKQITDPTVAMVEKSASTSAHALDYTGLKPIPDYRTSGVHKRLDSLSMVNFSLSFPVPGEIMTITTDAGAHGSHVAGIAAGYYPNDPSLNGVAPGAQIISLKIGDTRLGSMETGVGAIRALTEAVRLGCDVINMSYGEAAAVMNSGRFNELAEELVNKYNIVFVASAGNNGPALTTTGAPGGSASSIISVGAYVSPEMCIADYSMRETPLEGTNYTWSSVGPSVDGQNGVDIIAPGGAITNVPNWCLQKAQLMNGTSMSSPNCAGCIALLVSALKQNNIPYTSQRIKQAIFHTAKLMPKMSTLVQGAGMIQVEAAYEHLVKYKNDKSLDVVYEATIDRFATPRGVYLRQPEETRKKQTYNVTVTPRIFPEDGEDGLALETQQARVDFEMKMNLKLGPSQFALPRTSPGHVAHPEHLMLLAKGRSFAIEVDPTELESGLYTTHLVGYDSNDAGKGALFNLPITVVKPASLPENEPSPNLGQMNFGPAETYRFFLEPPKGATFMDITVRDCRKSAGDDASSRLMVLHTVQLFPHTPYRDREHQSYLRTTPGAEKVTTIKIEGGVTVEITFARFWSTLGFTEHSCDVQFRGILPEPTSIIMNPGCAAHVRVQSHVRDEVCSVSARLKKWQRFIRPKDFVLAPVTGARDLLMGGGSKGSSSSNRQVYSMTLTYEFKQEEEGCVTLRAPLLNGFLYESAFESQMAMFYNGDKKFLGVSDCWPEGVKCEKGTITVKFQIRHDNTSLLEQFEDMVVSLERDLKSPITLVAYSTHEQMVTKGSKFGRRSLVKGNMASMHFAPPASDAKSAPKGLEGGDVLTGSVDFESYDSAAPGSCVRPGGWDIQYTWPVAAAKKKEDKVTPSEVKDERTELEKMAEDQRDWAIKRLEKMVGDDDKKFNEVFDNLVAQYPTNLALLQLQLKHLDNDKDNAKWMDNLKLLIEKCDSMVALIDQTALAVWNGTKHDLTDGAVVKENDKKKKEKDAVCDALGRKCRALIDYSEAEEGQFDGAMKELAKWCKVEGNEKYAVLELEMCKKSKRFGTMLSVINKLGDGDGTKGGLKEYTKAQLLGLRSEVYGWCGWDPLVTYDSEWKIMNNMKNYQLH
jgi:tripeptidyl-peptidase-2